MIYDNITKATFLRRPNRFISEVEIEGRKEMDGVKEVRPYRQMHPEFGEAFDLAKEAGVEIWFLPCHVEPDRLEIVV